MKELHLKYRPKTFDEVFGQSDAVEILRNKLNSETLPHSILLHGPYGTGKTTLARIISDKLGCGKYDFIEKNSADYRGIDEIRDIRNTVNQAPIDGDVRIWLLDEIHKTTNDAQNAMLKLLEEPPGHAYFILATTNPEKLLLGIQQRCLRVKLNPVSNSDIKHLLQSICKKEKIKLTKSVGLKIIEYAEGSPREALQILDKIYQLNSEKKQLQSIEKASVRAQAITIARLLIKTTTKWQEIRPILQELVNEDPEQIRHIILGYGRSVVLKNDNPRGFRLIEAFRDNFFDSKFAGVVAACYEIIQG